MKVTKHTLTALILLLCLCFPSTGHTKPDYAKTPIFFVHGYGGNATCWKPIISFLMKAGYPKKYLRAIQLRPNNGSNIVASEKQLAPEIEDFLKSINEFVQKKRLNVSSKTKVHLISHSMGALSARWFAAKVRPDRVRLWISLGGASHGSNVLCGYAGQGADDLCPAFAKNGKESLVQYQLNGRPYAPDIDETPYGIGKDSLGVRSIPPDQPRSILYVSIRTSPDKWIKPEDSPILDGAGGLSIPIPKDVKAEETSPGNILMTNRVGHDAMIADRNTLRLVEIILGHGNK